MPKASERKTAIQVAAKELPEPDIRREHERTALGHAVAMRVIGYRIDRGLSLTALARVLGMHQPAIARLDAREHEPSLASLSRLARALGIEFRIDITPDLFRAARHRSACPKKGLTPPAPRHTAHGCDAAAVFQPSPASTAVNATTKR